MVSTQKISVNIIITIFKNLSPTLHLFDYFLSQFSLSETLFGGSHPEDLWSGSPLTVENCRGL